MKKYLYDYIKEIDNILNKKEKLNYDRLIQEHLTKINFFMHERTIHLLVTLFYGLFDLLFFYFTLLNSICFIILIVLSVLLIFYVVHYFRLENGVQYLYKQYDRMLEANKK